VADDILVGVSELVDLAAQLLEPSIADIEIRFGVFDVLSSEELIEADLEDACNLDDEVVVRLADIVFPTGYNGGLHVDHLGELVLGESSGLSYLSQSSAEIGHGDCDGTNGHG